MTKFAKIILWAIAVVGLCLFVIAITSCNSGQTVPVARTIELTWTAPGDDGLIGQASAYDGRYSIDTLQLKNNWLGCALIPNVAAMTPKASGQKDSLECTVALETGVTYYFAIKTADEVPNWSGISNLWSVIYADTDSPAQITDLTGKKL